MTNLQIGELLRDVAASYQLQDAKKNFFKISAYERAADAVEHSSSELKDIWDDGKLEDVPGVGPSIAKHLSEIFKSGKSKHFDELMKNIPKNAFKLMILPGIGIKTAMKLLQEGTKEEIAQKLKEAQKLTTKVKRHLLPYASLIASDIIGYMSGNKFVKRIEPLGSLRRKNATVGDIDLATASDNPIEVLNYFTKYPKTVKIIEKGEHSASIMLPGNVQADLIAQAPDTFGALLQHFTGSKLHNIALREYAKNLSPSLSLSEYGIKQNNKLLKFKNEIDFYNALDLEWIDPELRENNGEIESAKNNKLPKLVEMTDIKGDLQIHSDFDIETSHDLGESSMEDIIKKAIKLKYEYIAFTEHNPSKKMHTQNQVVEILKRKREKIEQLNYPRVINVFNSLEIDINVDGSLPVSDKGFDTLDFALVSIHGSFRLSKDEMTKRVLSALSIPKVKIFAHPTARKIQEREGIELDWPKVFEFCLKNNKWIEINCDPMRLDLPDTLVRDAVKLGVKLTLGTDAHHIDGLNNMVWGINVARRGWCETKNIVNCFSLSEFKREVILK
ncbi:MAG: helix-hairpin-helix domain-containing protein [Patescibacteria group bacterium]